MEWTTNGEIIFENTKNKDELRLPKSNLKNLRELNARGNRLHNPLDQGKQFEQFRMVCSSRKSL